ncbi:MAG: response regulator [Desulfobulbaceae bacterium]|nr:response regulator [Desulfobulbaceae bacterium]
MALENPKQKILFVDDEPHFLSAIERMLHGYKAKWDVDFATNVDEAYAMVLNKNYDAIVSDISMPRKSGFDFLRMLQQTEKTSYVPVIILTGNAEAALKREALSLGAADLLNKPIMREDLVARLQSILRLKHFQDQLAQFNEQLADKVKERTRELELARQDLMWRLAKAAEYRDEETGGHITRVAVYCLNLAIQLGLDSETVERIFLASPLHDVGKIGISDVILLKPGKLTPEERRIMETHTEIGAAILTEAPQGMHYLLNEQDDLIQTFANEPLKQTAANIAISHHEKWDGSGYPKGLRGDAIPLEGQIAAVADVYDALRSVRPYKPSFAVDKVMGIMRSERGKHFSPQVLDAFEKIQPEFEEIRAKYLSEGSDEKNSSR